MTGAFFVACLAAVAQVVAAVVLAFQGSWVLAGLLVVGALAVAWVALRLARPSKPPPTTGYVERSQSLW